MSASSSRDPTFRNTFFRHLKSLALLETSQPTPTSQRWQLNSKRSYIVAIQIFCVFRVCAGRTPSGNDLPPQRPAPWLNLGNHRHPPGGGIRLGRACRPHLHPLFRKRPFGEIHFTIPPQDPVGEKQGRDPFHRDPAAAGARAVACRSGQSTSVRNGDAGMPSLLKRFTSGTFVQP